MIRIYNVYNLFPILIILIDNFFIFFRLTQALRADNAHIIINDFNLYYLYWGKQRYFVKYVITNGFIKFAADA